MFITFPEFLNASGDGASISQRDFRVDHVKIDSSPEILMTSACSLIKALCLSLYKSGMFTLSSPSKQCAISSFLVVSRVAT